MVRPEGVPCTCSPIPKCVAVRFRAGHNASRGASVDGAGSVDTIRFLSDHPNAGFGHLDGGTVVADNACSAPLREDEKSKHDMSRQCRSTQAQLEAHITNATRATIDFGDVLLHPFPIATATYSVRCASGFPTHAMRPIDSSLPYVVKVEFFSPVDCTVTVTATQLRGSAVAKTDDVSLLPPRPGSWRFVTASDFGGIVPTGNWTWGSAPSENTTESFTAPRNTHVDEDSAFLTDRAFPAGFNASFAFRWPRTTDPGNSANEIGTASFVFGAASAADHYAVDFPGLAHMFSSGAIWAFVCKVSADGVRTVLHQELLKEVSPAPGIWHNVSVQLMPAYPADAYPPAQPLAIKLAVDGAPLQPLEDGALQRDGSRLDLSELQTRVGFVGFETNNYDGELAKSRFRAFSISGGVMLNAWNATKYGPQAAWGEALPRRAWGNIGRHNSTYTEVMAAGAVTAASDSSLLLQAGTWGSPTSFFFRSQDNGYHWVRDAEPIPQDVSAGATLVRRTAANGRTSALEFWLLGPAGNLSISRSETDGRTWSPRKHVGDLPIPQEWERKAKNAGTTIELSLAAQPQELRDSSSSTGRVWVAMLLVRWQPPHPAESLHLDGIVYTMGEPYTGVPVQL